MREKINHRLIIGVLSRSLFILAISFIICMVVVIIFNEPIKPFFISMAIVLILNGLFFLLGGKINNNKPLTRHDAYLTVTLTWLSMSLVGCMPYIISGSKALEVHLKNGSILVTGTQEPERLLAAMQSR